MSNKTSSIQKNNPAISQNNIFLTPPLKIYRKEIASANIENCNPRISTSIDEMNSPGGYLVNPIPSNAGILNTLDINLTTNQTERPGSCSSFTTNGVCLDPGANALNRVRSAGMVRKIINYGKITEPYCTTSQQYLATRGKLFTQNQYNFLRKGNSISKPGSASSAGNEYAVNVGINYCAENAPNSFIPVYYKPNNSQFSQEGGVSSSARLARLKYDTITNNGASYTKAYGSAVGNALSYGVTSDTYTIKDKIGYPNICTPKFSKYSSGFAKCSAPPSNMVNTFIHP